METKSKRRLAIKKGCFGQLSREHLEFLTFQQTLTKQAGLSLYERAAIFNMKYRVVGITGSKLFKIYRAHGIKYKKVKTTKVLRPKKIAAM